MKVIVTATGEYEPVAEIQEIFFHRTISKYPVFGEAFNQWLSLMQ